MAVKFKQKDAERVEDKFNDDLPDPYTATAKLKNQKMSLAVRVKDPKDKTITVCDVEFQWDAKVAALMKQPDPEEVKAVVGHFVTLCNEHAAANP